MPPQNTYFHTFAAGDHPQTAAGKWKNTPPPPE
jgi:hypothetical protein